MQNSAAVKLYLFLSIISSKCLTKRDIHHIAYYLAVNFLTYQEYDGNKLADGLKSALTLRCAGFLRAEHFSVSMSW